MKFSPVWVAILLALIGSNAADGQADFPLKNYEPVDFFRQSLALSPSFSSNSYRYGTDGYSARSYDLVSSFKGETEFDDKGINLELYHEYWKYVHGFEFSGSNRIGMSGSGSENKRESGLEMLNSDLILSRQNSMNIQYQANCNNSGRWYWKEKVFLGFNLRASFEIMPWLRNTSSNQSLFLGMTGSLDSVRVSLDHHYSRSDNRSLNLVGKFPMGFGRIYDVSFPARILFILERIKARTNKDLRLDLNAMTQLQAFLETRRQQRSFYDTRAADIYDVESLDIFLRQKAGVENFSAGTILDMADEWRFSARQMRKSGWEAMLFPYYKTYYRDDWDYSHSQSENEILPYALMNSKEKLLNIEEGSLKTQYESSSGSRSFDGYSIFGLGLALAYERPIHRVLQFSGSVSTRIEKWHGEGGNNRWSNEDANSDSYLPSYLLTPYLQYGYPAAEASLNCGLTWYPSTRSTLSLSGGADYRVQFEYTRGEADIAKLFKYTPHQDVHQMTTYIQCSGEYYLSARLSFQGGLGLSYDSMHQRDGSIGALQIVGLSASKSTTSRSFYQGIHGGLKYYLF